MIIQCISVETNHELAYVLIAIFLSQWQDALLDRHLATGTFDEEIIPIGRPVKSLVVKLWLRHRIVQHYLLLL
jgi:hypothetical protein